MKTLNKIGFGGGCHWCTEAVFQSLKGIHSVAQGWIASKGESETFSEAVIVEYNSEIIPLKVLTEIHLRTHKSTSEHSMRTKYRSAVYFFEPKDKKTIDSILKELQSKFDNKLITKVLPFIDFLPSGEHITNYYYKNPQKPFCENFINPKLKFLLNSYPVFADKDRIGQLD